MNPYSNSLLDAFPAALGPRRPLTGIPGSPPSLSHPPPGCRFHQRCNVALPERSAKEPELGNAIAPANWDGPFILSPHDSKTIYAGTNRLWKSTDRGDTWTPLGLMTTGVDRSTLPIMGNVPTSTTSALQDAPPCTPALPQIA